jgi:hypothetical protein
VWLCLCLCLLMPLQALAALPGRCHTHTDVPPSMQAATATAVLASDDTPHGAAPHHDGSQAAEHHHGSSPMTQAVPQAQTPGWCSCGADCVQHCVAPAGLPVAIPALQTTAPLAPSLESTTVSMPRDAHRSGLLRPPTARLATAARGFA